MVDCAACNAGREANDLRKLEKGEARYPTNLFAGIAQSVEHLTCNQGVPSSTLGAGTK